MKNHEKAFSDIKNYYNDITLNNLALINSLKVRLVSRSYSQIDEIFWKVSEKSQKGWNILKGIKVNPSAEDSYLNKHEYYANVHRFPSSYLL